MKVGLVPMAAKPYHAGHHMLIELAAISELTDEIQDIALPINDAVGVFISFTGRGVRKIPGEGDQQIEVPKRGKTPVFGADMKYIWQNILKPNLALPSKVQIITPDDGGKASPIQSVHSVCEALKSASDSGEQTVLLPFFGQANVGDVIVNIYSDDRDVETNYSDSVMTRLYGSLWKSEQAPAIRPVGVPRSQTVQISGTQMREYLCAGDIESLMDMMPPLDDDSKKQIADILINSISCGMPLERRQNQQEMVRQFIKGVILIG